MGSAWSRKQAAIDASFEAAPRDVNSWDLQHVNILHQNFRVRVGSEPNYNTVLYSYVMAACSSYEGSRSFIQPDRWVSRRRVHLQDGGGDWWCVLLLHVVALVLPVWVFRVTAVDWCGGWCERLMYYCIYHVAHVFSSKPGNARIG